jgi:Tol biopolymer transport system component
VFGSEEVNSAYNVNNTGTLWTVDVSGGEPKRLDPNGARGLYQPSWSPSGKQIAFWSVVGGQRDLETIPAAGGPRVKVTNDPMVNWAPVWSPDGKYLYVASDRGGTMGIWRIPVDEESGASTGVPVLVASGVDVNMDLPHLSADGNTLIFRSKLESVNPATIAFDPATGRIGDVTLLQQRTGTLVPTDLSPDGKWLVLNNAPDRRQDIFIMRPDGSELRRLTDDDARDWNPRFAPDGNSVTFFSNASGKYDGWSIQLDGGGRTKLTDVEGGVTFTMFAPDGKRLMAAGLASGGYVAESPWPVTAKSAKSLNAKVEDGVLTPTYWTRNGRWLSGYVVASNGEPNGQGILDVTTDSAWRLNRDSRAYNIAWLPGYQRVAYFTMRGALVIQDIASRERRATTGQLPYPPDLLGSIVASADGKTLYYGATQSQSNIWLARRPVNTGGSR